MGSPNAESVESGLRIFGEVGVWTRDRPRADSWSSGQFFAELSLTSPLRTLTVPRVAWVEIQ